MCRVYFGVYENIHTEVTYYRDFCRVRTYVTAALIILFFVLKHDDECIFSIDLMNRLNHTPTHYLLYFYDYISYI